MNSFMNSLGPSRLKLIEGNSAEIDIGLDR